VAAALGDPLPDTRTVLADLLRFEAPHHARSCCAFGMDLEVDFAGMEVPLFEVGNVIAVEAVAVHAYDVPDGTLEPETNGLIYTCRGGWIDTAHVRENADTFLYVALRAADSSGTARASYRITPRQLEALVRLVIEVIGGGLGVGRANDAAEGDVEGGGGKGGGTSD
jgi:hypothetical protein